MIPIQTIAKIAHEANATLCEAHGDFSQEFWEFSPQWQKESAIKGVQFRLENPDAPASAQHEAWLKDKVADGWVYGNKKDAEKKTHPCIVPYDELPEYQKRKDALFQAIVDALK